MCVWVAEGMWTKWGKKGFGSYPIIWEHEKRRQKGRESPGWLWEDSGSSTRTGRGRKRRGDIRLSALLSSVTISRLRLEWVELGVRPRPSSSVWRPGFPQAARAATTPQPLYTAAREGMVEEVSLPRDAKEPPTWQPEPSGEINSGPPRKFSRRCPSPDVKWKQFPLSGKMTAVGGGNKCRILWRVGFLWWALWKR